MNQLITIITKIKVLFLANKKLLIPLIPLVLFVLIFIIFISFSLFSPQRTTQNQQNQLTPTVTSNIPIPTVDPTHTVQANDPSVGDDLIIVSNEEASNFQKQETLPDGSIKNYLTSERSGRPNIIITSKDERITLFESSVFPPKTLPRISDYLSAFGSPEQTYNGSKFYGSNARTYVYAQTNGIAFIGDPQTNTVFEMHHFARTSVNEYITKFGEDIVNTTPAP